MGFAKALLVFVFLVVASPVRAESKGKILVVLSSSSELTLRNGKKHSTGFYLNELTVPLMKLVEAGYEPVFGNPKGNPPTMDPRSDSPKSFHGDKKAYDKAKSFLENLTALQKPKKLAQITGEELKSYRGVFVPGGHAPMEDLVKDAALGKILTHFHEAGKPTALICHGPVALLSARSTRARKGSPWPYVGYRMTAFSRAEEARAEATFLGGDVSFYLDQELIAAGADVRTAPAFEPNVVRDRELITGQNPASDDRFAKEFLRALETK